MYSGNYAITDVSPGKTIFALTYTNNSENPVTIIGVYRDIWSSSYNASYMLAYAELDEPVTVQPGESKTIQITIDFNNLQ